jgi:hypothetical protein
MRNKSKVRWLLPLTLIGALLACNLPPLGRETAVPPGGPTPEPVAATLEPVAGLPEAKPVELTRDVRPPTFGTYAKVDYALPVAYSGYTLPIDVAALSNADYYEFSPDAEALLAGNGFVVVPAEQREFFQAYEQTRYDFQPGFVTTDSVYHIYHLIFDKMLRDLERDYFEPDIAALTAACLNSAQTLYAESKGTELEAEARSALAYFAVAEALINPGSTTPPEVADLVNAELALIEAHEGLNASPIFSQACPAGCDPCDTAPPPECLDQPCLCEDYSQYVPRGHYTRSEQLQRYFRTMMWYGRINMRLQRPSETRMALLITYILRNTDVNGQPASEVWARVYDPTVFIVGKSDDLGFYEYGGIWDAVYGEDAPPSALADDQQLATFIATARTLPPPQVNSMWVYIWEDEEQVTQGFRLMGQRFTLDAYIFEQLIWREVGEQGNERWLPKGLDVMAALGSEEAYSILDEEGETAYLHYPEQMQKVWGEVSALEVDSWTQNLYWAWLYSLQPLLTPKGAEYPAFMQTTAWTRKDLHAALASWTELKHDTILYAKQVMAEMGGGGGPEEPPKGYVEPNPEAYARLLALTRMTADGLSNRGLLSGNTEGNLARLEDLLVFLLDVSQRELAGETLSDDDYWRIHYYGGELESMTLAASDQEGEGSPFFDQEEDQAPVVADVATDPNGRALEEGTGYIFDIYVVVPDGEGGEHIAKGGAYSYYEFDWPMSDRLTDESWRAMLAGGSQPARPDWTASFISQ